MVVDFWDERLRQESILKYKYIYTIWVFAMIFLFSAYDLAILAKNKEASLFNVVVNDGMRIDESYMYIAGLDKILGRTFGDVNGDGKITDDDAQDVLRIVAGLPNPQTNQPYTQDQKKNADVNNDGQVTSSDALLIQRFAQGLDKVLAKMGDVNGDGQITDADSQAILKIVGGLPPQ